MCLIFGNNKVIPSLAKASWLCKSSNACSSIMMFPFLSNVAVEQIIIQICA
jgi:hypothetical protein